MKAVLDNRGPEKTLEVTAARELEPRDQLLGNGGSTDYVAAL